MRPIPATATIRGKHTIGFVVLHPFAGLRFVAGETVVTMTHCLDLTIPDENDRAHFSALTNLQGMIESVARDSAAEKPMSVNDGLLRIRDLFLMLLQEAYPREANEIEDRPGDDTRNGSGDPVRADVASPVLLAGDLRVIEGGDDA